MKHDQTTSNTYALGHTQHELDRLIFQERFIGDLTEHMLRLAGLKAGMRVLDVGCGVGDVHCSASSGSEWAATGATLS